MQHLVHGQVLDRNHLMLVDDPPTMLVSEVFASPAHSLMYASHGLAMLAAGGTASPSLDLIDRALPAVERAFLVMSDELASHPFYRHALLTPDADPVAMFLKPVELQTAVEAVVALMIATIVSFCARFFGPQVSVLELMPHVASLPAPRA